MMKARRPVGSSSEERAEALVGAALSLGEAELRVAYLRRVLRETETHELAAALDVLCARAERADPMAREVLLALVDALQDPALGLLVRRLRDQACAAPYLALDRLVRYPTSGRPQREVPDPDEDRVPDYGRGRPLTLGERKALARKPDRATLEKLLRDPHPEVIRQLLVNPKLTEDGVLSLASRRPCRPDVLVQIVRVPRWTHRPRIRMALVLNPDTPLDSAVPLVGLLVRQELRLVVGSTTVAPLLRALSLEYLDRRPPLSSSNDGDHRLQ
jgi:hypothetical protein